MGERARAPKVNLSNREGVGEVEVGLASCVSHGSTGSQQKTQVYLEGKGRDIGSAEAVGS